jgi:hypothetical protein
VSPLRWSCIAIPAVLGASLGLYAGSIAVAAVMVEWVLPAIADAWPSEPGTLAMLVGLAALVLDYLRARKLDDETASRVVDLTARVAVLEAVAHERERGEP